MLDLGFRVGEERGAQGGVDRRSDNATSVDVEIDPHRRRLGRSQTYFALQAIVECRRKRNESQCCCVGMIYSFVGGWQVGGYKCG